MTGFQVPRTTYKLQFDDPDYAGLEVSVRGTTLDELFALDEAQEAVNKARGARPVREALRQRNALFVDKITEWNLEDDGVPIPCTLDKFCAVFEAPFAKRMFEQWRDAASGAVPAPLAGGSTSGEPTPDESTLLAIPSESLAS